MSTIFRCELCGSNKSGHEANDPFCTIYQLKESLALEKSKSAKMIELIIPVLEETCCEEANSYSTEGDKLEKFLKELGIITPRLKREALAESGETDKSAGREK